MKSFILILGLLLFCTHTYSQTADEEAIKKVCIAETQAYVDFDGGRCCGTIQTNKPGV